VAGAWLDAGKVRVFPATGGKPWVYHADLPVDTAFSPDGRHLAVTSAGSSVHVIDVATHHQVLFIQAGPPPQRTGNRGYPYVGAVASTNTSSPWR
jgi:hypothetical protein